MQWSHMYYVGNISPCFYCDLTLPHYWLAYVGKSKAYMHCLQDSCCSTINTEIINELMSIPWNLITSKVTWDGLSIVSTKLMCKHCLKKDPINETEHRAIEMVRSAKYGTGWNETPQGKKIKEIPRDFKSSPCTQFQNNEITFQGESATKKLATKTLHIVRPVDWEFKASGVKGLVAGVWN